MVDLLIDGLAGRAPARGEGQNAERLPSLLILPGVSRICARGFGAQGVQQWLQFHCQSFISVDHPRGWVLAMDRRVLSLTARRRTPLLLGLHT
jgi:hypothetical protein